MSVSEWVSVERAAAGLEITMAECARLVVQGTLATQLPQGVVLSSRTVRVSAADVARVREMRVVPGSAGDVAEADRILTRRNVRCGWPPEGWCAPSNRVDVSRVAPVVSGVDHAERVWRWLFGRRRFEVLVSEVRGEFAGVGKVLSVSDVEKVLAELESVGVVEVVKIRRRGPGPRPRGVRLSMWAWGLVQERRWVSMGRLREGGWWGESTPDVKGLTTQD